ncbi:hypothetical protein BSR29_05495 [Boudabousia liubingyangii]|uniref:Rhodanese domain-containing protein n=2 Tax=Boudabousia liubingyangii TaxID=1921764 RepID=A0A1Q5PLU6_9ACTO|nr:hypothetical protein BSR28_05920 [Boudabousia liubingyangii]OKL48031.1 hypothetical protein BSR29_05495 [Boudabousia liubingyangii]
MTIMPLGLSACGGSADTGLEADPKTSEILDVRTPAEFAEGHLEGAKNIDFNDANFKTEVQKLDPKGSYVLYCRSGNRAGKALSVMKEMGFEHLANLGSLDSAHHATGKEIVK